ncbi:putative DNA modification/repair radical SAM protein [Patescibacteria group bacterium]|nr:putative DNA modification/repair radical SAM protein [Patescibacteria group bacterium]
MRYVDLYNKISILGPEAKYDTCGPKDLGETTNIPGVYNAKVAGGNVCRLFKVLQTNACKNNCNYCALRRDRDVERVFATPDEMASAFYKVYSRRLVDGFFLSSGVVNDSVTTMSRMIDTVRIVRERYKYTGYVHMKIMPGTPENCLDEVLDVSNRVSLNIESPTQEELSELSPDKNLEVGFFETLNLIREKILCRQNIGKKVPSLTTQFVIGAGSEKDINVVKSTKYLYDEYNLKRVFYSAFRPVPDTPLEDKPEESITRAYRLYQTDFLMRFYEFKPEDFTFDSSGRLIQEEDPKLVWAKKHPEVFPMNVNRAKYYELLKIPGVGPESAKKIIKARGLSAIKSLDVFSGMRIQKEKMKSFVSF